MKKHLFGPDMPLFKIPVQLTYMTCKWVKVINKLRPVLICSQTSLINFSSEKMKAKGKRQHPWRNDSYVHRQCEFTATQGKAKC